MYVDESPFQLAMKRRRGRSLKEKPARSLVPVLKGVNHSVRAAIVPDFGLVHFEVHRGKHKKGQQSVRFAEFIQHVNEKLIEKGINWPCFFIMDNASFHKPDLLRPVLRPSGHTLKFLPRYTPDFNPIENCFSVWKAGIKREYIRDDAHLRALIWLNSKHITDVVTRHCWDRSTSQQFARAQAFEEF